MVMPEAGRQAAHILMDAVSSWDIDGDDEQNSAVAQLALARLNDVGAVSATLDDATDDLTLDLSHLLGGAMVVLQWLVTQLALCSDEDREYVIAEVRAFIT